MKKEIFKVLICIIIINITVISLFLLANGNCAIEEIDSKYGHHPIINGYIDLSAKEWSQAFKDNEFKLEDLPIKLWVMNDDENLYISVQIEIFPGYHSINEFIGLIISNSSSENKEDFIDAKIIQFTNISANEYNYFDYNVSDSVFLIDTEENGDGAAKLEEITSTYEFALPIKGDDTDKDDAALDYGNDYAFNITYGETQSYPDGIKKSAIVLINIKSLPPSLPSITNLVLYILIVIVFSIIGILLFLYIYRIFKLKKYMERYKR